VCVCVCMCVWENVMVQLSGYVCCTRVQFVYVYVYAGMWKGGEGDNTLTIDALSTSKL